MISLQDNNSVRINQTRHWFCSFFPAKKERTFEELGKSLGKVLGCVDVRAQGWSHGWGRGQLELTETGLEEGIKPPLKSHDLSEFATWFSGSSPQ